MGKYGKIAKLPREVQISYAFAYVFATFAASPAPIMEAAFGRPPCGFHRGCGGGGKNSKNISKSINKKTKKYE